MTHDRDEGYRTFSSEFFDLVEALDKLPEDGSYQVDGLTLASARAGRRAFYAFRKRLLSAPEDDYFARLTAAKLIDYIVQVERKALDGSYTLVFRISPFVLALRRKVREDRAEGRVVL